MTVLNNCDNGIITEARVLQNMMNIKTFDALHLASADNGSGNYTEERDELLKDLTIDDIASSINKRKGQQH